MAKSITIDLDLLTPDTLARVYSDIREIYLDGGCRDDEYLLLEAVAEAYAANTGNRLPA